MKKCDVRAILDGQKTQMRRVVISPYKDEDGEPSKGPFEYIETPNGFAGCIDMQGDGYDHDGNQMVFSCPYGAVGRRLWVREDLVRDQDNNVRYTADRAYPRGDLTRWPWLGIKRLTAPFMPRKFSRLTLEITSVRVEQLHDIDEWSGDLIKEGATTLGRSSSNRDVPFMANVASFAYHWDRENAKRGFSWSVNPWVWVIDFRRTI